MRILALDSAVGRCSATILADGDVLAGYQQDVARGQASVLPVMLRDCLNQAGMVAADLELIAVTVGPGSFTGIRGGVALAQGIAVAANRPVIGVTVGEALGALLPHLGSRTLWCTIASRRGRIFLEAGEQVLSVAIADLPYPAAPVALAGDAAADIASRLAARGANVMLTDVRLPTGWAIAAVAARRFSGTIRSLAAEPLYVDAPEAKRPEAKNPNAESADPKSPAGGA